MATKKSTTEDKSLKSAVESKEDAVPEAETKEAAAEDTTPEEPAGDEPTPEDEAADEEPVLIDSHTGLPVNEEANHGPVYVNGIEVMPASDVPVVLED